MLNSGKNYIVEGKRNFYYSATRIEEHLSMEATEIKELISYIIDETYVKFGPWIFRQTCGVPMGGNASPTLADLTLSMLEYGFLSKSENQQVARSMGNTVRYIDDLLTMNYEGLMDIAAHICYG